MVVGEFLIFHHPCYFHGHRFYVLYACNGGENWRVYFGGVLGGLCDDNIAN
jgi:hypothetical protein